MGILEEYDAKVSQDSLVNPGDLSAPSSGNVEYTLEQAPEQRESTFKDYWVTVNPSGMAMYNPELSFTYREKEIAQVDTEDETFSKLYNEADVSTQREMLSANNTQDAIKIAQRRKIFLDSQKAIAQDGLMTQIAFGAVPAILSPTNAIPIGYIGTVGKLSYKLGSIATGALMGATAGLLDEAVFDMQGMPTNYLGVAAAGAVFGGGLGAIERVIAGPHGGKLAKASVPESDTYAKDFAQDPNIKTTVDENGIIKLENDIQLDEDGNPIIDVPKVDAISPWLSNIPYINKIFVGDPNYVYAKGNSTLRGLMSKLTNPTVSIKDANGNAVNLGRTATDAQRVLDGHKNKFMETITEQYAEAKKAGFKGTKEDFRKQVYDVYSKEMVNQRNFVTNYMRDHYEPEASKLIEELETKLDELNSKQEWFYKKDSGRKSKKGKPVYEDAPLTEDLIGKIPDEKLFLKGKAKKELKDLIEKTKEEYNEKLETLRRKAEAEAYSNYSVELKGEPYFIKSAESMRKYFQDMLQQGQNLGVKGLDGIHLDRLYAPRTYEFKKIKSMNKEEVMDILKKGVAADARNRVYDEKVGGYVSLSKESIDKAAEAIYNKLITKSYDVHNMTTSFYIDPKNLGVGGRTKQQKLYLNDNVIKDILHNNVEDVVGAYHYGMRGRIGLQYAFGRDTVEGVMKEVTEILTEKKEADVPEDVLEAFHRTVQDVAGTLRMNQNSDTTAWSFTRGLQSYNALRLGGGFGANQLIELAASLVTSDFGAVIEGRLGKAFKHNADILFNGSKGDEFAKFMLDSGYMSDALDAHRANRYADNTVGFNSGWLENKLQDWNSEYMKWNGMRYFIGVTEEFVGSTVVTRLRDGKFDADLLARWGLDEAQAKRLQESLKQYAKKGGDWEISKMTPEDRDLLQLAVSRGIEELVVQGDSIHLPAWMKDMGPVGKILTQFMRFPMLANEILLRRGLTQDKSFLVAGAVSSILTFMMMKYLREQAAIKLGLLDSTDTQYDYFSGDEDQLYNGVLGAVNYTANLGMLSGLMELGFAFTKTPIPGKDWAPNSFAGVLAGPSGSLAEDLSKVTSSMIEGEWDDDRTLRKIMSFAPGQNLPFISEGVKALADEYGN